MQSSLEAPMTVRESPGLEAGQSPSGRWDAGPVCLRSGGVWGWGLPGRPALLPGLWVFGAWASVSSQPPSSTLTSQNMLGCWLRGRNGMGGWTLSPHLAALRIPQPWRGNSLRDRPSCGHAGLCCPCTSPGLWPCSSLQELPWSLLLLSRSGLMLPSCLLGTPHPVGMCPRPSLLH